MTDPITQRFGSLGNTYPGSRQQRRQPAANIEEIREEEPTLSWDKNPKHYVVKGVSYEFFTIGHLAKALGKSTITIRDWEREGWLPQAKYRTAPRGKAKAGLRLYSRAQIEGIIRIAKEEGLLDTDRIRSFAESDFPARVHRLFEETR